ncbi:hypothetical protein ACFXHA_17680 [Nocardia sp. NPDC059240]|uniref:hypothetical protein n=1 Tax=Nocardia sp. NPDC059240 TaxID=3346786 RepID=UPI00368E7B44
MISKPLARRLDGSIDESREGFDDETRSDAIVGGYLLGCLPYRELFALWLAIGEHKTLDRIRKAIRTPSYRRDLTVLPRDLQPRRMG